MKRVNLSQFKSHLSDYTKRVKSGETVILCERNVPIAELRPRSDSEGEPRPAPGLFSGQIAVTDSFFGADGEIERDFFGANE